MSAVGTIRTRRERRLAARAFSVGGPPGSFMCRGRRRARPAPLCGCAERCPRSGLRCVEAGAHTIHQVSYRGKGGGMTTSAWETSK